MLVKNVTTNAIKLSGYIAVPSHHNKLEYIKSFKKGSDFPRFHIVKERDGWTLHCDMHRVHGKFVTWMHHMPSNIICKGKIVEDEAIRLSIIEHELTIEKTREKINKLKEKLIY